MTNIEKILNYCEVLGLKPITNISPTITTTQKVVFEIVNDTKHERFKNCNGCKVITSLNYLNNNNIPYIVSPSNKYSCENINIYSANIGIKSVLLDTIYINKSTKMQFVCECGNLFETRWNNYYSSHKTYCEECGMKKRINTHTANKITKNGSFKDLLINEYGVDGWNKVWNQKLNQDVNPDNISCRSHTKVFLNCLNEEHHIYEITCYQYHSGIRCGFCVGHKVHKLDTFGVKFPHMVQFWGDKNDFSPYDVFYNSTKKAWFKCPNGKHEETYKPIREATRRGFRCIGCGYDSNKGENNHNWKGGKSTLNTVLRDSINVWKKNEIKKSGFKCALTGLVGDFELHHLKSFSIIVDEFIELYNISVKSTLSEYDRCEIDKIKSEFKEYHKQVASVVLLKKDIHRLFHSLYGNSGNNTEEEYYDFEKRFKNNEFDYLL